MFLNCILSYGVEGMADPRYWSTGYLFEMQDESTVNMIRNQAAAIYGWTNANPKHKIDDKGNMIITSNLLNQVITVKFIK
jgi:hypothetical protein